MNKFLLAISSLKQWKLSSTPVVSNQADQRQSIEENQEEEDMNGCFIGYAKDSSESWGYANAASTTGRGLYNNVVGTDTKNIFKASKGSVNMGLTKRCSYINSSTGKGKELVMGDTISSGLNYVENTATAKNYYLYVVVRCQDLPFLSEMPMAQGTILKITFTLNSNIIFKFSKGAGGVLNLVGNLSNVSGYTNPFMVSANSTTVSGCAAAHAPAANAIVDNNVVMSGSVGLPVGTYTVNSGLVKVNGVGHPLKKCRFYVNSYTFNPEYQASYTSNFSRVINYTDIAYSTLRIKVDGNSPTPFEGYINTGIAYAKRLIMIASLSVDDNGNGSENGGVKVHPFSSPFTTEPSTTSPFKLKDFNVYVAGNPIYARPITYDYEQFLIEMNGQYGLNGNMIRGAVGSYINYLDYANNYHYIVVNLSRQLDFDISSLRSIMVKGTIESKKSLEFHCFIETSKHITIDCRDGSTIV